VFTYLDFSEVLGGAAAACDRLPDAPAVYALFRNIKLPSPSTTTSRFVAALEAAISAKAAPDRFNKVGPLHKVTLECRSDLTPAKKKKLEESAHSLPFREFLASLVEKASLLQSPLYVGKAEALQGRIRQHLDPMSDLATRLRDADISINGCTLAYAVVQDCPLVLDNQTIILIEEIISRLCRPGFVNRIG